MNKLIWTAGNFVRIVRQLNYGWSATETKNSKVCSKTVSPRRLVPRPCQSIWDLWWIKWHLYRLFSKFFGFPLSISFHRGSILKYHLGDKQQGVEGRSSETSSHPIDMNTKKCVVDKGKFNTFMHMLQRTVGTQGRYLVLQVDDSLVRYNDVYSRWSRPTVQRWALHPLAGHFSFPSDTKIEPAITVSIVSGYGLDDRAMNSIPGRGREFFL
jgi:hypothetical protein